MRSIRIATSPCKPQPLFICIKPRSLHSSCSCHWDRQALQLYLEGGPSQVNLTARHPPAKASWATSPTSASDEITCCFTFLLQNLALRVTSTTDRYENLLQPEQQCKHQVRILGHLYRPLHAMQQGLPPALPETDPGSTAAAQRMGRSTGW